MSSVAVYSLVNKKENAHDDPIYSCALARITSQENPKCYKEYLVTGGLDSLVKVWSLENNRLDLFHTLEGHSMAVVSVAVSPDGHTIATSSLDATLIIWELTTGMRVHSIQTPDTDVWKLAFSPNTDHVVSGSHTCKLTLFDVVENNVVRVLDTRGKFSLCVAWSKSGEYIASGDVDGAVYVFNLPHSKLLHRIEAHTEVVRTVNFSPNSQLLVTASNDGFVKIFELASGNLQNKVCFNTWVLCARFSPDGTRVGAAVANGSVNVMLAKDLSLQKTFQEHSDTVWDIQFNLESNTLLSVGKDKCINVYECILPKIDKNNQKR